MRAPPVRARARGFTLTELAIVALIIALLAGGLLMTLAAQNDNRELVDTRRTLEVARDALIGFAVANGRLPCPASAISNGSEAPIGGGACTVTLPPGDPNLANLNRPGFVPAITLGIGPTNSVGQLVDAWGNPVRYAVTRVTASTPPGVSVNAFTTGGALKAAGYAGLTTDLAVCVDLPGAPAGICPANRTHTFVAVVVFSTGKSGGSGPLGADETENLNGTSLFVTHVPVADFDDLLVSLSPNVLYGRLVAAGAL